MLIVIENLLNAKTLKHFQQEWTNAQWQEGRITAGAQATQVKDNLQLLDNCPLAKTIRTELLSALSQNEQFISAALPKTIYPPKFNCYQNGGSYGTHVDNAILTLASGETMRTDLSATVFLSEPDSYEGGELIIETTYGAQEIKLAAGDMVLYPSTSLHQVLPVTKGVRLASFFWIQSLVGHEQNRTMLYDLDQTIQSLKLKQNDCSYSDEIDRLTGIYHNLVRQWAI